MEENKEPFQNDEDLNVEVPQKKLPIWLYILIPSILLFIIIIMIVISIIVSSSKNPLEKYITFQ